MSMEDVKLMTDVWAKLKTEYPRYAMRWSDMTGDFAYQFRCPGWVVMVAPRSWREIWSALPEPRIPELSDREFEGFLDDWLRHIQVSTLTRGFKPGPC